MGFNHYLDFLGLSGVKVITMGATGLRLLFERFAPSQNIQFSHSALAWIQTGMIDSTNLKMIVGDLTRTVDIKRVQA